MIFWLIVGIAIGYVFRAQIDVLVGKVVKRLKDRKRDNWDDDY